MTPAKVNLTINQGASFSAVYRWGAGVSYRKITAATKDAPCRLTSALHGIPDGWPISITGAKGMSAINVGPVAAKLVDTNTLDIPVNTVNASAYSGGGVIEFATPVDLTGYTARMQIRKVITDADPLVTLTTENSGITLDPVGKVTVNITDEATALYDWTSGVYDLELVSAGGQVTRIAGGKVTVTPEVTRD